MSLALPARASTIIHAFSFGGGVQSVAVMALQMMGRLDRHYDAFVFANVGEKMESPDTLAYFRNVILPLAATQSLNVVEVCKRNRHGEPVDLYDAVMGENRSVPIPMWLLSGAPGTRSCTTEWKIRVVDKWLKSQGATHAVIGLGISSDEWERKRSEKWHDHYDNAEGEMGTRRVGFWRRRDYPLLDMGISRAMCLHIIAEAGLPEPPPSACHGCPFKGRSAWIWQRMYQPGLFAQNVGMENRANEKRQSFGKDEMYLHRDKKPLEKAVPEQMDMFARPEETTGCQSGVCFT
jgi:hypothetical protein